VNIIVALPHSNSPLPRLWGLERQQSRGLSQLTPILTKSEPEKRSKIRQVQLGNPVRHLGEIEVLRMSQKILDNADSIFAPHLPSVMVEPFI